MKLKSFALIILIITALLVGCGKNTGLEDTEWVLESYGLQSNLKAVLPATEVTATFDSINGQVSGSGGCNGYGGRYELSGNRLSIPEPLIHTEMSCGEDRDQQEREFFMALQSAESYLIVEKSLTINCGDKILVFRQK